MGSVTKDKAISINHSKDRWADEQQAALSEISERVLERAAAVGASAAEVSASSHAGISVTVRMQAVETLEFSRDRGVGITVYFGLRKGNASSADLSAGSVDEAFEAACEIARRAEPDPCHGLAEAELMATRAVDLDLWHPWDLEPDRAIEMALEMEQAAFEVDPLIRNSEGATLGSGDSVSVYANSHGFVGARRASRHSLSCVVLAANESSMQRDYWYDTRRDPGELQGAGEIGREAGRRALRRHGARPIATTSAPVLFAPEVARSLLGNLASAVSGGNLYRGSSFLCDRLGDRLFPEFVNIEERPLEPRGLRSTWYDAEGVATRRRPLVAGGVLEGYVLSSYSARRLGMQSTGNAGGVHNLTLSPGKLSHEQLIADLDQALVVTELMGHGVSIVTGDYSQGASGFWVESGKIVYPVERITIAGNLERMFAGVAAVGADLDDRAAIRSGSILIDQMTIAGE